MEFFVYIVRCADGSYYTGHTERLEYRIRQHQDGTDPACYTYTRRPVEVVYCAVFESRLEALASERRIKGWCRRKKEALMREDWAEVSRLARSRSAPSE